MNDTRRISPVTPYRLLAEQAFSRAAGAPLGGGNTLGLLIDAPPNCDAWLKAIGGARRCVLRENYMVRDDEVGCEFRDALVERAKAGILVAVVVDWLGWPGPSPRGLWPPLRAG